VPLLRNEGSEKERAGLVRLEGTRERSELGNGRAFLRKACSREGTCSFGPSRRAGSERSLRRTSRERSVLRVTCSFGPSEA
jgi:hypothetical protein